MAKKSGKPYPSKKPYTESRTSKRKIEALQKEQKALELRIGGAPYRIIGEALGYADPSGAAKAVYRALDRIRSEIRESADQYIQLQLERLDKMLMSIWSEAVKGRYGAIDRVLKIEERRARLLGLDDAQDLIIDWRKRLEDEGISASELYEKMVAYFMEEIEKAKANEDDNPSSD